MIACCAVLAGCAREDEIGDGISDAAREAPAPELVATERFQRIEARQEGDIARLEADTADLAARAARLRARAAALHAPDAEEG